MDPYTNDDSTSNQSDSSSSSTNIMSRLLHGNSPSGPIRSQTEQEPIGPIKRTLMTKNAGTSEKRKRNISGGGSSIPIIKREPQIDLNDEVRCIIFFYFSEILYIYLGRYKNS
jgi:hypothetical protein